MASFGLWFRGLRFKLILVLAIPLFALCAVGVVAIHGLREEAEDLEKLSNVSIPVTSLTGEMRTDIHATGRYLWLAINTTDAKQMAEALEEVHKRLKVFSEHMRDFQDLRLSEKARNTFKPVPENWGKMESITHDVIALAEKNKDDARAQARRMMAHDFAIPATTINDALKASDELADEFNKETVKDAEETARFAELLALSTIIISGFLAFVIGVITASRLARDLSSIATQIAEGGVQVSSASEQLSSASQQLSVGATESASSLEETVASVEQLSSMVKLNAENAKEASNLSQASRQSAEEGESEIRKLNEAMGEIAQSSKKIEEIINVIDDIAFQTNLLALNAAVEAARAGEQGKGFAVVAEAVRTLAQRSAAAAKDITTLIKDSVHKIDRGAKIADEGARVLKNIVVSVKKVDDLNNEISSASQEQSNGLSQISKAMNELDQATQRNASSAEETAAASEEMSSQAVVLQTMVVALSSLIDGQSTNAVMQMPQNRNNRPGSNNRLKMVHSQNRVHSPVQSASAENIIPFNNQDEPSGKVGTTAGF